MPKNDGNDIPHIPKLRQMPLVVRQYWNTLPPLHYDDKAIQILRLLDSQWMFSFDIESASKT